jgi:hypothetical protein
MVFREGKMMDFHPDLLLGSQFDWQNLPVFIISQCPASLSVMGVCLLASMHLNSHQKILDDCAVQASCHFTWLETTNQHDPERSNHNIRGKQF